MSKTLLEAFIKRLLPSSRVEVFILPSGSIEARVRYSEMDWEYNTTEQNLRAVRDDLVPRRPSELPKRRRLHWGKRK